jgi:hypothetical protein
MLALSFFDIIAHFEEDEKLAAKEDYRGKTLFDY